jgi:hypothetical protein
MTRIMADIVDRSALADDGMHLPPCRALPLLHWYIELVDLHLLLATHSLRTRHGTDDDISKAAFRKLGAQGLSGSGSF